MLKFKRIMAASTAALLATTSLVAVASADYDANKIVVTGKTTTNKTKTPKPVTIKIRTVIDGSKGGADLAALKELFTEGNSRFPMDPQKAPEEVKGDEVDTDGNPVPYNWYQKKGEDPIVGVIDPTSDAANPYSALKLALWETAGLGMKIKSGNINVELAGKVQDYVRKEVKNEDDTITITLVPDENGPHEAVAKGSAALSPTEIKAYENEVADNTDDGARKEGTTTPDVDINLSFGLSNTAVLQSLNLEKTRITVDLEVEVKGQDFLDWKKAGLVMGDDNLHWDWEKEEWVAYSGTAIDTGLTVVGNSYWEKGKLDKRNAKAGTLDPKAKDVRWTLTQDATVEYDEKSTTTQEALPWIAFFPITFGENATPEQLRNLNKGGTVTFKFDKALPAGTFVSGFMVFIGSNNIPITVKVNTAEAGDSLTLEMPAGLTYAADNSNQYIPFTAYWHLNPTHTSGGLGIVGWDEKGNPTTTTVPGQDTTANVKLVSVTFEAKGGSSSGNQGGLVEDDKNKPSTGDDNKTPSNSDDNKTPSNSTNNGGDSNKNPSTGVAMAVAPVALAAAAAFVVISKKRK